MSRIRPAVVDYACAVERTERKGSDGMRIALCIVCCIVIGVLIGRALA